MENIMARRTRTQFGNTDKVSGFTPNVRRESTKMFGKSLVGTLKALVNPKTSIEEQEKICKEIGQAGHLGRIAQTRMPLAAQQLADYAKGMAAYNKAILDVTKIAGETTNEIIGYQSEASLTEQKFNNVSIEQRLKQKAEMDNESIRHNNTIERTRIDAYIASQQAEINHDYGLSGKINSIKLKELQEDREYYERVNTQLLLGAGEGKEFIARKQKVSEVANKESNPITEIGRSLMKLLGL